MKVDISMKQTEYAIITARGHVLIDGGEGLLLVDTGSPMSFHELGRIRLCGGEYRVPASLPGAGADYISDEQLWRIISAQGADKVLFGSDCPWDHPEKEIAMLRRLPLTEEEQELIFHKNAEKLLKISTC